MWWSKRAFLLLVLAGCGFAPAYGINSPARALIDQTVIDAPGNRDAFDYVGAVEAQLGRSTNGAYRLAYNIGLSQEGAGITLDGDTTRYILTGTVDYTLTKGDARLTGGTVKTFTAWSATGSTVAGLTAEADAHRRLMQALADLTVRRLTMELK
jgi:LPS-assembly lipoprotein